MAEPTTTKRGTGWIVFAGVLMVIAGANMFINGAWALHTNSQVQSQFKGQLLFSDTNLDTWGWIFLIVGFIVLVAGFAVFARQHWAVNVGVIVALIQAILAFFWIFTGQWPAAVVVIAVDLLVIYGLTTYGER